MYAPVGKQWSLATIRWWGRWAEGEHVCLGLSLPPLHRLTGIHKRDTLICYLLNELYYYEEGHGDALRPIPKNADKSFLGDLPATKHEVQAIIHAQLAAATDKLMQRFKSAGQAGTADNLLCSSQRHGEHNPDSPHMAHVPLSTPPLTILPERCQSMPHGLHIPTLPKRGPMDSQWKHVVQDCQV